MREQDRQLLQSAASAVGKTITWVGEQSTIAYTATERAANHGIDGYLWNPLDDSGDALELQVDLHMTVRCYRGTAVAQLTVPGGPSVDIKETNHADPFSAARRAIVRAAAAHAAGGTHA